MNVFDFSIPLCHGDVRIFDDDLLASVCSPHGSCHDSKTTQSNSAPLERLRLLLAKMGREQRQEALQKLPREVGTAAAVVGCLTQDLKQGGSGVVLYKNNLLYKDHLNINIHQSQGFNIT